MKVQDPFVERALARFLVTNIRIRRFGMKEEVVQSRVEARLSAALFGPQVYQ
jgi:hypothetical protein